jgi:hypothetical protein
VDIVLSLAKCWTGQGILFLIAMALIVPHITAAPQETRAVEGSVTDKHGNKLPKAVVYLENTATLVIKTYVVQADGMYHFDQLNPNVDYTLSAKYRKLESKQRRLSEFNSARLAVIDLMIPAE